LSFKLTPGLFFFFSLLVASVAFSGLLNRIEDNQDKCMELRIEQSRLSTSIELLPLVLRLDELLKRPESEIAKSAKDAGVLDKELTAAKQQTDTVCEKAAQLNRSTAFVQALITALLALVGLYSGFWLAGRQGAAIAGKTATRSSRKPRKNS
jgi:hypothetical protein